MCVTGVHDCINRLFEELAPWFSLLQSVSREQIGKDKKKKTPKKLKGGGLAGTGPMGVVGVGLCEMQDRTCNQL